MADQSGAHAPRHSDSAVAITGLETELAVKDPCEVYVGPRLLAGNLWFMDDRLGPDRPWRRVNLRPGSGASSGDIVRVCFRGISPSYFEVMPDGSARPMQRDEAEREARADARALVAAATGKVMLLLTLEPNAPTTKDYVESILADLARDVAAQAREGGGR